MTSFHYVAVDGQTGREDRGSMDAVNAGAVVAELKSRGLYPTRVETVPVIPPGRHVQRSGWGSLATGKTRALFTRQLATLLKAGMPMLRGLEVLARQQPAGRFKEAIEEIAATIRGGGSLSDGLARFPRFFDPLYVNMVKAGEASGALESVLQRLAEFLEKSQKIRGQVKAAMMYPLIIMVVAVSVVSALIVFVVPRFESIFANLLKGQPLPGLTQTVLAVSRFVHDQLFMTLGLGVALVIAGRGFVRSRRGRRIWDRACLAAPLLGDVILKAAVARFSRTLGTLLAAGVHILEALHIARDTTGNSHIAQELDKVSRRVKAGEGLSRPLEIAAVFPAMVASMVEVGEETGQLPEMLHRIADTYEGEVDNAIAALTSLLEPLMIVLMSVVVGIIVIALFLPLARIIQTLS